MTNEFFKHLYTAEGTERMEDVRSVDSSSDARKFLNPVPVPERVSPISMTNDTMCASIELPI